MAQEPEQEKFKYFIHNSNDDEEVHVSKAHDYDGCWLESRFHFNFSGWQSEHNYNSSFGCLHVLNDDIVAPGKGFGFHPHRNQEIFSYIIDGKLSHEDSKGNKETLSRGAIQYMSAGVGVYHSEMNNDPKTYCRFLQTWITPSKSGLPVQYGSKSFSEKDRKNKLLQVISSGINKEKEKQNQDQTIQLHQDCNVYVSELDKDKSVQYDLKQNRQLYLVNIEGKLIINNNESIQLETRDSIRIWGPAKLTFSAVGNEDNSKQLAKDFRQYVDVGEKPSAHFMMIEMEQSKQK